MTNEEKQLLLADLCARLPYAVKCNVYKRIGALVGLNDYGAEIDYGNGEDTTCEIKFCKPYLRPLSSMTNEEIVDFLSIPDLSMVSERFIDDIKSGNFSIMVHMSNYARNIDWLNKNMFDYRGLIPKGRAIEVTEKNNPYKD